MTGFSGGVRRRGGRTSFYMDRRADDFASVFSRWKKVRDGLAATWFDHTLPARSWTWIAGDRSLEKSEF